MNQPTVCACVRITAMTETFGLLVHVYADYIKFKRSTSQHKNKSSATAGMANHGWNSRFELETVSK